MTEPEHPEFLGPLRDQLVQGAAAHKLRRRRRAAAVASVAAALIVVLTIGVATANRDDVEILTAPPDQRDATVSDGPITTVARTAPGVGAETSRWSPARSTLAGASYPGLFWTGDRLLVVNTENGGGQVAGELWDPATNTATPMAPSGMAWRVGAAMGWTGDELLIIGGSTGSGLGQIGAAYRPATDSWRTIADPPVGNTEWTPAPSGPAMWTGDELVMAGSGLAYRPADDSWRTLARSDLSDRARPISVGTGSQVVVWGGCWFEGTQCDEVNQGTLGDGAVYDVATDTWTPLPPSPLAPAVHAVGVWDGDEVVITVTDPGAGTTGARTAAWSPVTGAWRVLPDPRLSDRRFAAAAWTGAELVVWGGTAGAGDGAVLDPVTGTWRAIEPSTVAPARSLHSMVWAGDRIYISSTLNVSPPVVLRLDVDEPVPEQATAPPTYPPDPLVTPPGTSLTGGGTWRDLSVGADYLVDVDLECRGFQLMGTWVLDEGDLPSPPPTGERHERGAIRLDAVDHGTYRSDAGGSVATFRRLPEGEEPSCVPLPS